ncbi:MAG: carbohydrate ABC transporter permease [Oscillibacter sp.]|nr:carbohydrate ABC transporter permease [Oscillibacter sp.]MBD5168592.1 carbohydrate ABC transporter permease [Oscillibacter sp.]
MGFFKKYARKEDGVIRFYDLKSGPTRIWAVLIFIACIAMAVIALYPVFWLICSSLKDLKEFMSTTQVIPKNADWEGWVDTWNSFGFTKYYINSGIAVAGGVVCAVFFNGLMAYVLAILKPRGYKIVFALVMWCLLIPPTTSFVALFVNIKNIGLTKSFVPLWLSMGANAYWVVLFKNFFEGLPKDYIDAARLDGCGSLQIFTRIVLPLSRSIIVVVAIFAVTAAWSDFLMPYLLLNGSGKETVMVKLYSFNTSIKTNQLDIIRAVLYSIIPPTIIFTVFQKQIMGGVMDGGIKG